MATFDLSNKVNIVNPSANVDAKYGPWASLSEAKTNVVLAVREKGLTVGIIENEAVVEYWWKTGTADGDLVLKTGGSSGETHTHDNKAALDLINKDVNNNPTWNGGAWPGSGVAAPTANNVNTALQGFTEGTPQDSDFLVFIGKIKITLANFKTLLATAFVNTFAAKTHGHTKSEISDFPTIPSIAGLMLESEYTGTGTKQVNYAKSAYEAEQAIHSYSANQDALGREIHSTYALKQSGVTPPETARVILDDVTPTYTIVALTAENLIVENNALSGEILAPALAADKTLKISILGNDTLLNGTSYADGVTIFAIYEASTETWTFASILDPEVPDYSDMTVDVMLDNPTLIQKQGYVFLSANEMPLNSLVLIRTHAATSYIGVYQCTYSNALGANLVLIAAGTALHTIRVKDGDVWYSQYDGKNAGSLVFDNTKKRVDALFAGSINAAAVDVSTWKSGEERPIGAMKDPTTGEPVFAPNIEVVDVYSISAVYKAALETESNWIVGGLPQPFWVSAWGLQGMRHQNNNYMYECIEDNKWIRYPLVAILDIYAVSGTEVTKLTTAGNWTGVNYTGTALVGCYKGMRHINTTHVYEFYDDNLPCRTARV